MRYLVVHMCVTTERVVQSLTFSVVSHEDLIEGVSVQKIRMVAEQWLLCSWREWFGFGL